MNNLVVIGIGGTGAKILESIIHLAASSNMSDNIYPILIDQDIRNGNVVRCKTTIDSYIQIRNNIDGSPNTWIFRPTIIKIDDALLPLVPENANMLFRAAIGEPNLNVLERKVVHSLISPKQLDEPMSYGYKKRAYIGSILMAKLIEDQENKPDTEPGFNMIISELATRENLQIFVCGSFFGGTGTSGIARIGEYFRKRLPHAVVKAVSLTPYYNISRRPDESNLDQSLVRSDSDMQLLKVAIEMYKNEMAKVFDYISYIGSDTEKLTDDIPTEFSHIGGEKQTNPAHVFELLASTFILEELPKRLPQNTVLYYDYVVESTKEIPPYHFCLDDFPITINKARLKALRNFASAMYKYEDIDLKWKSKQVWFPKSGDNIYNSLYTWCKRHHSWWEEMSPEKWNNHSWKCFALSEKILIDEFDFSKMLARNILNKSRAESIKDVLLSVNEIEKNYKGEE